VSRNVVCCSWEPVRRQGEVQALQTGRAQQEGLGQADMATVAAGRAGRWAVVSGLDGYGPQGAGRGVEFVVVGLSHCCDAYWPEVRGAGVIMLLQQRQHSDGRL
jgi:hypothetical protein